MKLGVPFFGSSSGAKKQESSSKRSSRSSSKNGKSASFGSTASTSSDECATITTPRTVLPPSASSASSGTTKRNPAPLTREDLEVALRRVVTSEAELAEMLADDAPGGSGTTILLEEIIASEATQMAAADEGELKEAFAVFDADGDGRISAEELHAVLASLGDDHRCSVEDCRRMIGGVDVDGDGFVCFNEFTRMMTQGV